MSDTFLDYISVKKIVTVSTFLAAFTYGYVAILKQLILDPVFDYLFPMSKVEDMNIVIDKNNTIQLGRFILETVRWILYMVIFHTLYVRIQC